MNQKTYPVPEQFAAAAKINHDDYRRMYAESIEDPEHFWARIAHRIEWIERFRQVKDVSYAEEDFRISWFAGGKLNVATNRLDRHLENHGDKTAIIWEGDDPERAEFISYRELYE